MRRVEPGRARRLALRPVPRAAHAPRSALTAAPSARARRVHSTRAAAAVGARLAATAAGGWAVLAVAHAIRTADAIAAGAGPEPGQVALRAVVYFVPLALVAVWLLLGAHTSETDSPTIVRSMRMGLTVALFGVLLSWGLVLYSAFVASLVAK